MVIPSLSISSGDVFDTALSFMGESPERANGFQAAEVPGTSGLNTRQGRLKNRRPAVFHRKLIHWLVPEGPMVQMYVNPQNITYQYTKEITPQRTKGGFVVQYWGENIINLSINGTTGTSGIEGINVLYDLYRNEQLAFDPYALNLAAQVQQNTFSSDIFGVGSALSFDSVGGGLDSLLGITEEAATRSKQRPPSLAKIAATVEMYWSGEVYRGFFKSFRVEEKASQLGFFDYTIEFSALQKRGFRQNFLGWHRSAVSGCSNSDPVVGRPHSFGQIARGGTYTPVRREDTGTSSSSLVDLFDF